MSEDQVTISKPLRRADDPLLDQVEKTYTGSFPEEERRDFSLVRELVEADPRFELYVLSRDGKYVGFLTGWQFDGFVYAEHFAIDPSARNGGIGAKAMRLPWATALAPASATAWLSVTEETNTPMAVRAAPSRKNPQMAP